MELECAGAAVDSHHLAVGPAGGGVAGGDHGGDAVLAGDQGGVDGQGAAVGETAADATLSLSVGPGPGWTAAGRWLTGLGLGSFVLLGAAALTRRQLRDG